MSSPSATAASGIGVTLVAAALPFLWKDAPGWFWGGTLALGVLLLMAALAGFLVKRFPARFGGVPLVGRIGKAQSRRMSLTDIRDMAAARGWDFGPKSLHCMDLALALNEAARIGDLRFYGRVDCHSERLTAGQPLQPIPQASWGTLFLIGPNLVDAGTENLKTRTFSARDGEAQFCDVHVDRPHVRKWLRTEAARYRGRTQPA